VDFEGVATPDSPVYKNEFEPGEERTIRIRAFAYYYGRSKFFRAAAISPV
jgi:hypothetical protein